MMEEYISQLLADIERSIENARFYFPNRKYSFNEWISEKEEEETAPEIAFDEFTGIRKIMLPPDDLLSDDACTTLLKALENLIKAYHLEYYFLYSMQDRVRYRVIRENVGQTVQIRRFYMGNFKLCSHHKDSVKCSFGYYCQCGFDNGFNGMEIVQFVDPGSHENKENDEFARAELEQFNLEMEKLFNHDDEEIDEAEYDELWLK